MDEHTVSPQAADLLMTSGVVRRCPDCTMDQIFMPVDDTSSDHPLDLSASAYCCTSCGAAILIDLFLEPAVAGVRGVA